MVKDLKYEHYLDYRLTEKKEDAPGIFLMRFRPGNPNKRIIFEPGQYADLAIPGFAGSESFHHFSLASPPTVRDHIEFCIKVYGGWTRKLTAFQAGDKILVSPPMGNFTWERGIADAVFLAGGVGLAPLMSMARYIRDSGERPRLTFIYGARTPRDVAYRHELEELSKALSMKLAFVYSGEEGRDRLSGYRGFITEQIVSNEASPNPGTVVFVSGLPVFVKKMHGMLKRMSLQEGNIRFEDKRLENIA